MNQAVTTSTVAQGDGSPFLAAGSEIDGFLRHFGFRESPFGVTSDPSFLFGSEMHNFALQEIIRSIEANLGFSVLLGEPGTGKTTLLVQLLTHYRDRSRTAFIFQTQCRPRDLLRYIASDFELRGAINDQVSLHHELQDLLIQEAGSGRKVVIIIDEAQNLRGPSLEAIRLLSNFETGPSKLLNVVLAGQPRLAETLLTPELSQLAQRISTICRLQPLTPEEVKKYVCHRLAIVTSRSAERIFSPQSLVEIAAYSKGVPRSINAICYRALVLGYNQGQRSVNVELVEQAEEDLDLRGGQQTIPHQTEDIRRATRDLVSPRFEETAAASPRECSTRLRSVETRSQSMSPEMNFGGLPAPRPIARNRPYTILLASLVLAAGSWIGWNQLRPKPTPIEAYARGQRPSQELEAMPSAPQAPEVKRRAAESSVQQPAGSTEPVMGSTPLQSTTYQAQALIDMSSNLLLPSKISRQSVALAPTTPSRVMSLSNETENLNLLLEHHPSLPQLEAPVSSTMPKAGFIPRPLKVIQPDYPAKARLWHIEGEVHLELTIDRDGRVEHVRALSGNPVLVQAAVRAVQQWQYSVPAESGPSVPTLTEVRFHFRLNSEAANR